jgi:GDPmannose 4,6-dehydratase
MFNTCGILFNHESERRGHQFVTRKISDGVARIAHGVSDSITLGNLDAKRDWGYAPDYVESMWLMLQQDTPDDFVIATGKSHSIREFLSTAFEVVGILDWEKYIKQDPRFMRPAEVDVLRGDSTKAKYELGWEPKTNFKQLVKNMVEYDLALVDPKGWSTM